MNARERFLKNFRRRAYGSDAGYALPVGSGAFSGTVLPRRRPVRLSRFTAESCRSAAAVSGRMFLYACSSASPTRCTSTWAAWISPTRRLTGRWRIRRAVRATPISRAPSFHTPDGDLTQETKVVVLSRGTFLYAPTEKPVKDERDLDLLIAYEPRMPEGWEAGCARKGAADQILCGRRRYRRRVGAARPFQQRISADRPRGALCAFPHRPGVL